MVLNPGNARLVAAGFVHLGHVSVARLWLKRIVFVAMRIQGCSPFFVAMPLEGLRRAEQTAKYTKERKGRRCGISATIAT